MAKVLQDYGRVPPVELTVSRGEIGYCVNFALTNVFLLVSDLMLISYLHLATSVGLEEGEY